MTGVELGPDLFSSPVPSPRPRLPHSQAKKSSSSHPKLMASPRVSAHRNSFKDTLPSPHTSRSSSTRSWIRLRNILLFCLILMQLSLLGIYFSPYFPQVNRMVGNHGRQAFVTLLCDDSRSESTSVLVHSLRATGTVKDIVVLVADKVSEASRYHLLLLGASLYPVQLPPSTSTNSKTRCGFLKLHLWNLTSYDCVVFLESDMVAVRPLDPLFLTRSTFAAVPHGNIATRFGTGLMVVRPKTSVFLDMMVRSSQNMFQGMGEEAFLNEYFASWHSRSQDQHLDVGYNVHATLRWTPGWHAWVEPNLHVLHFSGEAKPWNMRTEPRQRFERKLDHVWWNTMYAMRDALSRKGQTEQRVPASCRVDFPAFSRSTESSAGPTERQLSVLLRSVSGRLEGVRHAVEKFAAMDLVRTVYVVLEQSQVRDGFATNPIQGKTVEIIVSPLAKPSNYMKPLRSLETECVLLCDSDADVAEEVLQVAFQRWRENANRLVGFYPRAHYWTNHGADDGRGKDGGGGSLVYVNAPRGEYSLVLANLVLMHADYLRIYSCHLPQAVPALVDTSPACLSLALNFMASHQSALPPLLLQSHPGPASPATDAFADISDGESVRQADASGTRCLRQLAELWGHAGGPGGVPLRNTSEAAGVVRGPPGGGAGVAAAGPWEAAFDSEGLVSKHPDENLKFLPRINVSLHVPELSLVPSEAASRMAILCLRSVNATSSSATSAWPVSSYSLSPPSALPKGALLLPGTTFVLFSRHLVDLHPYLLQQLLGSFLEFCLDHNGLLPHRLLLFRRGANVAAMSDATSALTRALLGAHVDAGPTVANLARPVCLERAVLVRRHRGDLADRRGLLNRMREKVWSYCGERGPMGGHHVAVVEDGRKGAAAKGRLGNVLEVMAALRQTGRGLNVRPFVVEVFGSNETFCNKIHALKSAKVIIGAHGEALASLLLFVTQEATVVEVFQGKGTEVVEFKEFMLEKHAASLGVRVSRVVVPRNKNSLEGHATMSLPLGYSIEVDATSIARVAINSMRRVQKKLSKEEETPSVKKMAPSLLKRKIRGHANHS